MKVPELIKSLFVRKARPEKKEITLPDNLFVQCPQCKTTLYRKKLVANSDVCPECSHHFVLSVHQWVDLLADRKSWRPLYSDLKPLDTLRFPEYEGKLKRLTKDEPDEAIACGKCTVEGIPVLMGIMNPNFLMGSLGSVAGEKITRLFEQGMQDRLPVFLVIRSGGARMQEGVLSLMQMAKTSAAIRRFSDAGLLYVSLLTHPTTGGVSASYAMLGDITLGEPKALIGFAGPRVIEQTIKQQLPPGFQKAEYVEEKGFLDAIVPRTQLKSTLVSIFQMHGYVAAKDLFPWPLKKS